MEMSSHHLFARDLDEFDPTCPADSNWYACPKGSGSEFVGCCSADPCASSNGCSQGNIRPVAFNASSHGTPDFPPDAACGTGSNFYTCVAGAAGDKERKTFWGCCKSNPCGAQKCPDGDLVPAFMSSPSQFQAYTGQGGNGESPSPSPPAEASSGTKNTAVIVGGTVGGVVVIVAIVSILIFCLCRRRKAKSRAATPTAETGAAATAAAGAQEKSPTYTGSSHEEGRYPPHPHQLRNISLITTSAPPTYTSPNPNAHPAMLSPTSGYKSNYQPLYQQPQELPVELPSSGPSTSRYSELPAESQTAQLAEMESPAPSPRPGQGLFGGGAGSPKAAELASPPMTPSVPQA
jgi:hypothetical protein